MPETTLSAKGILGKIKPNKSQDQLTVIIEKPLKILNLHKRKGLIYLGDGKETVTTTIPKNSGLIIILRRGHYVLLYSDNKRQQIMRYETWCQRQYTPKKLLK